MPMKTTRREASPVAAALTTTRMGQATMIPMAPTTNRVAATAVATTVCYPLTDID